MVRSVHHYYQHIVTRQRYRDPGCEGSLLELLFEVNTVVAEE